MYYTAAANFLKAHEIQTKAVMNEGVYWYNLPKTFLYNDPQSTIAQSSQKKDQDGDVYNILVILNGVVKLSNIRTGGKH